jgi:hypothetical protein
MCTSRPIADPTPRVMHGISGNLARGNEWPTGCMPRLICTTLQSAFAGRDQKVWIVDMRLTNAIP